MIKRIWNKIKLPSSGKTAATLDFWHEWKEKMKREYPIRYFLFKTIPSEIRIFWSRRITQPWYYFKCWIWKHYNVVKIKTLDPTWSDVTEKVLHVNFQLLIEFIEGEEPFKRIDWDATKEHKHAAAEMKELYRWWKEDWPRKEEISPDGTSLLEFPGSPPAMRKTFSDKYDNDLEIIAYRKMLDAHNKNENAWWKKEEEQLIRLMKIRPFLWT